MKCKRSSLEYCKRHKIAHHLIDSSHNCMTGNYLGYCMKNSYLYCKMHRIHYSWRIKDYRLDSSWDLSNNYSHWLNIRRMIHIKLNNWGGTDNSSCCYCMFGNWGRSIECKVCSRNWLCIHFSITRNVYLCIECIAGWSWYIVVCFSIQEWSIRWGIRWKDVCEASR